MLCEVQVQPKFNIHKKKVTFEKKKKTQPTFNAIDNFAAQNPEKQH